MTRWSTKEPTMKSRAAYSLLVISLVLAAALVPGPAPAQESRDGSFTKIPTVKGIEALKVGAPAPDFKVKDLEGKDFSLKSCCGKDAVLLFFWSFFCGPCRDEMPMINAMTREFGGKGLQVVGVNLDGQEMKRAIDKFVANEKTAFRIVFDELAGDSFLVADPYGVAGTPALFLVDKQGVISFSVMGAVTEEKLRQEIGKVVK